MATDLFERTVSYFRAVSAGLQTMPYLLPHELEAPEARMDAFIHYLGARTHYGSNQPRYDRRIDMIFMPHRDNAEQFYETHLHELIHWSGAAHRLNRGPQGNTLAEAYSYEEFVAQMGCGYLLEEFGRPVTELNFSYFTSYAESHYAAEALLEKADTDARRAADYLLNLSQRNNRRG